MTDVSIDLETLGSTPYSVILAIGAQAFDRYTGEMGGEFLLTLSATDCVKQGLRMDPDTVLWWMHQSEEARKPFVSGGGCSLEYALWSFNDWLKEIGFGKHSKIWGNGSGFDINLLEDAYRVSPVKCPFEFWQARDVRTIVDIAGLDKKAYRHEGTHHNALDDARNQARMVIDGIAALRRDS